MTTPPVLPPSEELVGLARGALGETPHVWLDERGLKAVIGSESRVAAFLRSYHRDVPHVLAVLWPEEHRHPQGISLKHLPHDAWRAEARLYRVFPFGEWGGRGGFPLHYSPTSEAVHRLECALEDRKLQLQNLRRFAT